MKKSVLLLCFLCAFMLSTNCKKEEKYDIYGTYQRAYNVGGEDYQVQLSFTENRLLQWIPVDVIPGHTASEVSFNMLSDNKIKIFNDTDCGSDAQYNFVVTKNNVTLTPETEDCEPRKNALSGEWSKVE